MIRTYKTKMEVCWTKEDMEKAITKGKSTKNIAYPIQLLEITRKYQGHRTLWY